MEEMGVRKNKEDLQAKVISFLNTQKSMTYFILTGVKIIGGPYLVGEIIEPGMGSIMKGPLVRLLGSRIFSLQRK